MNKGLRIIILIASIFLLGVGVLITLFGNGPMVIPILFIGGSIILILVSGCLGKTHLYIKIGSVLCVLFFIIFNILLINYAFYFEVSYVSDYEKSVPIWENQIPGNQSKSKLAEMNYNENARAWNIFKKFTAAFIGTEYKDSEYEIDTFTYIHGIKTGYEKTTFEDVPYVIPYTIDNSEEAVLVISGGAFAYKTIDGENYEGKDVAQALNKNGFNAFVLWYRSNPYENPIPQLDVQRAIRHLKAHANEYQINPNKIYLLGFSAGAYQSASFINQFMDQSNQFPVTYTPDKIDTIEDNVNKAALIYPLLSYRYNVPMLFSSYAAQDVRNEKKREELLLRTDLTTLENFNSKNVKQFVAYGLQDQTVDSAGAKAYINTAKLVGTNIKDFPIMDQGHGFHMEYYWQELLKFFHE